MPYFLTELLYRLKACYLLVFEALNTRLEKLCWNYYTTLGHSMNNTYLQELENDNFEEKLNKPGISSEWERLK